MIVRPGCVVSYVGPGWMGHAVEKTHGRGLWVDVTRDAGGNAALDSVIVRYPNGSALAGPAAHFAVWIDLLEQTYLAASGGPDCETC